MENKNYLVLYVGILFLIGSFGVVNAEKIWTFNNYTLNVSHDLYVGGNIYGNGSGLTNLNVSAIDLSGYVPYTGSNANVVLGDYNFSVGTTDFFVNANTGNVGIGTTSPGGILNIVSTATGRVIGANKDLLIQTKDTGTYGGLAEIGFTGGTANNIMSSITSKYTSYGSASSIGGDLIFGTKTGSDANIQERMTILAGGNVGIGTTTPQNKLNVIGDGNFTGTVYSGGSAVLTTYSETDPKWTGNLTLVPFLASANTFTNNNVFNQNLTVDTNTFFVNSNTNNVGVGTTSPTAKLSVQNGGVNIYLG